MNINGQEINEDYLTEQDKQSIGEFVFVKQRLDENTAQQAECAQQGIILRAAHAHLAKTVEDIVQRCVEKGEADDASKAD